MKQDGSFDALLTRGLLLAALEDAKSMGEISSSKQTFVASPAYLRNRAKLLADPFGYAKKKLKPLRKKVLQSAACFLLACFISLAAVMAAVPSARAKIVQWVREIYETYVMQRFVGAEVTTNLPQYEIGALPEGYKEVFRIDEPDYISITYQNAAGQQINFSYMRMAQGSGFAAEMAGIAVQEIVVNGLNGRLYLSQSPVQSSAIAWINENESTHFSLDMFGTAEELLHMAKSVS